MHIEATIDLSNPWGNEPDALLLRAKAPAAMKVTGENRPAVGALLVTVSSRRRDVATYVKTSRQPFLVAAEKVSEYYAHETKELAELEADLKRIIGEYDIEQRRLAHLALEEANRKAQAERAAAEAKAADERMRLAKLAARLADKGNTGASQQVLERAEAIVAAPVAVAAPAEYKMPVGGGNTRMAWKARVVNADLVPREYMVIDMPAIQAVAKATKGKAVIPGVEFVEVPVVSGR